MPARLSVVIPNWNGKRFLETCLESLREQTFDATEIILVDNASTDGSQNLIKGEYPEVRLIELGENRGFTGACNIGMAAATGEFVALLNNDTEVDREWAEWVVQAFLRQPAAGIVASKMLLFDRRDHFHTAGDYFTTDGRAGNRGAWELDNGQFDAGEFVFSACGGSAVYRRSMLDAVGMLDDDFFFLLEDMDLAWRAQLAGHKVWYEPRAVVYHHLSATGGGVTASYHDGRNGIWLLVKNVPSSLLRKYARGILTRQFALLWGSMKAWRGPEARARVRGMFAGLLTLRGALVKRKAIQASRRVADDYIESIMTPQ
ncbi:MAG: glycosyltransferase family 2 protein [Chloroflexota bacterium]|nr:glycosyltransferase family 2 protein [Chloroflexota bacterium]MDE2947580.1 glycosyltransferase family 2 protein [Chloroflexota bacterium]